MTAIADALLDAIKQYAQSLKKQMGIPLSKAQELTARAHSFADWHELTKVADRAPYDPRLRAAAISARGGPGLRIQAAIKALRTTPDRLAQAAGITQAEAQLADARARALSPWTAPGAASEAPGAPSWVAGTATPVDHLTMTAVRTTETPDGDRLLAFNLFDPQAHLVMVTGCPGWGKSTLGAGLAGEHYAAGGAVLYVDPLFNPEPRAYDKVSGLLRGILAQPDAAMTPTGDLAKLATRPRFTLVKPEREGAHIELLDLLDRAKAWLKPFSLVVIDEGHFPYPVGDIEALGQFRAALAARIDALIACGIAVVLISLEAIHDALPVRGETQACSLLLFGKGHYAATSAPAAWSPPKPDTPEPDQRTARAAKRGPRTGSLGLLPPLALPVLPLPADGPSPAASAPLLQQLQALTHQLRMSAGEHTSWIGVATKPEDDPQAFVAQQRWSGIEATFMALPNPLAEFEAASA